jgi:hypothetical protein
MDSLKTPNQLMYFINNELSSIIGFSIDESLKPTMWFKEHDDNITKSKFTYKNIDKQFPDYVDKLVVQFSEYSSPCLCANINGKYISIITLNTDNEHKATYKLLVYRYKKILSNCDLIGTYYSYFS